MKKIVLITALLGCGILATGPKSLSATPSGIRVTAIPSNTDIVLVRSARSSGWVRPAYGWAPGRAVAAGAAIGRLTAATAAKWAPPPAPGLCWYYTAPTRRQGFWDACP